MTRQLNAFPDSRPVICNRKNRALNKPNATYSGRQLAQTDNNNGAVFYKGRKRLIIRKWLNDTELAKSCPVPLMSSTGQRNDLSL